MRLSLRLMSYVLRYQINSRHFCPPSLEIEQSRNLISVWSSEKRLLEPMITLLAGRWRFYGCYTFLKLQTQLQRRHYLQRKHSLRRKNMHFWEIWYAVCLNIQISRLYFFESKLLWTHALTNVTKRYKFSRRLSRFLPITYIGVGRHFLSFLVLWGILGFLA